MKCRLLVCVLLSCSVQVFGKAVLAPAQAEKCHSFATNRAPNGEVSCSDDYNEGSVCTFICDNELDGPKSVTCTRKGWSGEIPTCKEPASLTCDSELQQPCADNELCVYNENVCDGKTDCYDASDELNCANITCPEGQKKCADNRGCLYEDDLCDGFPDCRDQSDEVMYCENVPCKTGRKKCADKKQCVENFKFCDGFPDCSDFSDETSCENFTCSGIYKYCGDGKQCILADSYCDDYIDCADGTDEQCDDDRLQSRRNAQLTDDDIRAAVEQILAKQRAG